MRKELFAHLRDPAIVIRKDSITFNTACITGLEDVVYYLNAKEIGTIIHYPIPPHLAEAYQYLGHKEGFLPITEHLAKTVLSIPMYNGMTEEEQTYVINALNEFE